MCIDGLSVYNVLDARESNNNCNIIDGNQAVIIGIPSHERKYNNLYKWRDDMGNIENNTALEEKKNNQLSIILERTDKISPEVLYGKKN